MKIVFLNKFISILLLANLLFSTIGSHVIFKYLEHNLKKEIKKTLLSGKYKKDYKITNFTYQEFLNLEWEHSKEFVLGNNIYDVVSIDLHLDYIQVIYYQDIKESNLRQNYSKLLNSYLTKNNESKNLLFNFIEILIAKYIINYFNYHLLLDINLIKYIYLNNILNYIYIEIPNPPPRINS